MALFPFLLFALVRPWPRLRRDPFFLWFIATFPLFAVTESNANRANAALLPVVALFVAGSAAIGRRFPPSTRRRFEVASAGALTLITITFPPFYWGRYRETAEVPSMRDWVGRSPRAIAWQSPASRSFSRRESCFPYLYVLINDRVDPGQFQRSGELFVGADGAYAIPQVDGVYFERARLPHGTENFVFVGRSGEEPDRPGTLNPGWSVRRF